MTTIKAIETRLAVADVQRSATFYLTVLGFQVGTLWPEAAPEFAILHRDGLRLQLGKRGPAESSGTTLCLDVTDVLDLHSTLKEKVTIDWGPEVYFYGRREFSFKDPDGHCIIVSEVTDDPVTCPDE